MNPQSTPAPATSAPIVQRRTTPWGLILVWAVLVSASFAALAVYGRTSGESSPPPTDIEALGHAPTITAPWRLVMAIHPRCPCTRASVAELQRLLAEQTDRLRCDVYVYQPADAPAEWADTSTARTARDTPGVTLHDDVEGAAAERYGIATSGGVVLYDASGVPRYHGGITASRGHEGPNTGTLAITAAVAGRVPAVTSAPVYGCRLRAERGDEA